METIKKEKKADLEQLLNSLIEKGWKPFGDENVKEIKIYSDMDMECIYWKRKSDFYYFSPRKITSKESWLWQFVCENKMIPYDEDWYTWYERTKDYYDDFENSNSKMLDLEIDNCYEYRLIESALCDEDKLEDFLLNSIKLD